MPTLRRHLATALVTSLVLTSCIEDIVNSGLEGYNLVLVSFHAVESSGISGLGNGNFGTGDRDFEFGAIFSPTVVGQQYVAHIHTGSCAAIGPLVRALPAVPGRPAMTGGTPSASVTVRLPATYWKAPYVMDLHVTIDGVERRVACGSFA